MNSAPKHSDGQRSDSRPHVGEEERLTLQGKSSDASANKSSENDNRTMTATSGRDAAGKEEDGGKPTIGEELFLVHMARHQGETPSEDDFDREGGPRKRTRSIGEELYLVHLARSNGMEPDIDTGDNIAISAPGEKAATTRAKKSGRKMAAKPKKPARCSERLAKVMHLRNRDVKKMMIS